MVFLEGLGDGGVLAADVGESTQISPPQMKSKARRDPKDRGVALGVRHWERPAPASSGTGMCGNRNVFALLRLPEPH